MEASVAHWAMWLGKDFTFTLLLFELHRLHETQTIVADDRGVCLSVCLSLSSTRQRM